MEMRRSGVGASPETLIFISVVVFKVSSFYFGSVWDLYHLNCFCHPQSDQSAQVIIYGNQKHNYLNVIKAVQLMVGKQLLISTSLINPFGTLIIDQHNRESINFYRLL